MSRHIYPDNHPVLARPLHPQDVETLARRRAPPRSLPVRLIGVAALFLLIAIVGAFA